MGYNGSNRKIKSSVIKKSSFNFGAKVVSNIIAWPITMAASAVLDSTDYTKTNGTFSSYPDYDQQASIDEVIPISKLSDKKYNSIKQDYKDKIISNEKLETIITDINQKLKRVNYLSSFVGFISPLKKVLSKKACILEKKIQELTLTKKTTEIDIREITNQKGHNQITLPQNSNVYLVFNSVHDYYYADNMYVIEREDKAFFEFNIPSILTLNFKAFQIIFYDSVLIITTKNDFAIINYSHAKVDIQQIHVLEKQLDSNIDYKIVKETWLHTCLNGTPDLRYRNNPKVYEVQYWSLSISLHNSFNICILFTAENIAQKIHNLITQSNLKAVKYNEIDSNIYDETIVNLTDTQKELCNIIKQIGFQPSKYITQKRPQFGSYVKRRRDQAILCVIEVSSQQKFTCFDFTTQKCYIYKKEQLLLD